MTLRESELVPLIEELRARLVGRVISNIWQPARNRVDLGFMDGTILTLVPRGPDARIHTLDGRRKKNPPHPFSFQGACRSRLRGSLTALDKRVGERVVRLSFGQLHLELWLTGNAGGLWLLEGDTVIAAHDGPAPPALPALPDGGAPDLPIRMDGTAGGWDVAVRQFFTERMRTRQLAELRIQAGRAVRRERKRLQRLVANLQGDLDKASGAEELRANADLLSGHVHTLAHGTDHVDLQSWEEPGVWVHIELNPAKRPVDNLNAMYRKARRLDRMGEAVLTRLDRAERGLDVLVAQEAALPDAPPAVLRSMLDAYGVGAPGAKTRRPLPRGVHRWIGPAGEVVLLGTDAKSNRQVSFQLGKGADWWMHLRERPGSHVLLKVPKGHSPSLEYLLAAGQITVLAAGIPVGASADVQYTRIRDVRSIPGSEHALVRVAGEKVLRIERDPAGLTGWVRDVGPGGNDNATR